MATRPASGGGRWVEVAPERLPGFLTRFGERHGVLTWTAGANAPDDTAGSGDDAAGNAVERITVVAADGAVADCEVPFPPLRIDPAAPYGGLLGHVAADRTVGVLLVRRGGYAAGVFTGTRLLASKVGSRHVQGRTAAGGWSQQRFARRRAGQAREAGQAAADVAADVLLAHLPDLAAVVAGGDRRACDEVLADRRLAPLQPLLVSRRLTVPDPRQRVLLATPQQFRAVRIRIDDPAVPALAEPPTDRHEPPTPLG
ncbi:MAG TPA: acVLRF1 family peptidyl-tRNA hydrolase [Mycobacteriales bacterium]|nr:acVLRF1 family peptidyl-tRNA hydrolase [Mycobacteriales bacterium]